jgi:hypothetical protein
VGHWIGLELGGNPGAVVRVGAQTNVHSSSVGYSSSSFGPVHFGLGAATTSGLVEVIWPEGVRQTFDKLPIDRVERLRRSLR